MVQAGYLSLMRFGQALREELLSCTVTLKRDKNTQAVCVCHVLQSDLLTYFIRFVFTCTSSQKVLCTGLQSISLRSQIEDIFQRLAFQSAAAHLIYNMLGWEKVAHLVMMEITLLKVKLWLPIPWTSHNYGSLSHHYGLLFQNFDSIFCNYALLLLIFDLFL